MSVARRSSSLVFNARPGAGRARLRRRIWQLSAIGTLLCLSGCARAALSSFLPSLSLGVVAHRLAHADSGTARGATERWDAVALVGLSFRPRPAAAQVPVRGELSPETWIAPCDDDDFICLQEAADAEQELRDAFGELQ